MRRFLFAVLIAIALVSVACGSLLVFSGRGILGHLPGAEVVIDTCELSGGGIVRLYEGSLGATTSHWYLVTLQPSFFDAELTFFQAYGQPILSAVACQSNAVELLGTPQQVEWSFSLDQIANELVNDPLSMSYGEMVEGRRSGPLPRLLGLLCGSPLLLGGGITTLAAFRYRQAREG